MKLIVTIATACLFLQPERCNSFIQQRGNFLNKISRSKTTLNGSRDISNLPEWAAENKIEVSPVASLSLNSGEDYGITLKKSSEQYEMILSVPKGLVLDSEYIRREWYEYLEPALDFVQNSGLRESALNFVLLVKIMHEHNLGKDSRWNSWIESLPRSFDTGVCMDELEISCLPPFAFALASFEKQQLEIFQEAYDMLKGTPIHVEADQKTTQWAFNVVMTRCWRYAQEDDDEDMVRPIVVPFGDMFNHKEPPNVMVKDSDSFDSVDFVLAQDTEVPEGKEVGLFLSYGLTNPHRFLTVFGFCDETMPEVFSQLLFKSPTSELINLGCEDRSKMVYRTADGGISTAIWDCILYTLLAQVPEEQRKFYAAHLSGNMEDKQQFHQKYALEEALTLRNHVIATANEFKDLVNKIDAMSAEEQAAHPRLPMIRRHNHFLYRKFDVVKQRIDQRAQAASKKRNEAN